MSVKESTSVNPNRTNDPLQNFASQDTNPSSELSELFMKTLQKIINLQGQETEIDEQHQQRIKAYANRLPKLILR